MSRACTICSHEKRGEIDVLVAAGSVIRGIARKFRVSEDAVTRHQKHVGSAIVEAARTSASIANVIRAESIVGKIRELEAEARRLQAVAESQGDTRAALVALRELRETLAAWSKLVPEAVGGASVAASPEWAELRRAILDALAAFPEARHAVVEALRRRAALGLPEAPSSVRLALSSAPPDGAPIDAAAVAGKSEPL